MSGSESDGGSGAGRWEEPDETVPAEMVVGCPMPRPSDPEAGMALHYVRVRPVCLACPHFGGILRANPDPRIAWDQRHQVLCRYPKRLVPLRLTES